MNLLFAAIGTIIGALIFVIADYRVLVPAFVCLFISSLAFTTFSRYRKEILSLLTLILIMFFNYNFRAEHLEFLDPNKLIKEKSKPYFKIEAKLNRKSFNNAEFIISLRDKETDIYDYFQECFLPYRFLLITNSERGLSEGDELSFKTEKINFTKISKNQIKFLKKEKVFFSIKIIEKDRDRILNYLGHEKNLLDDLRNLFKRYFLKNLGKEKGLIQTSLLFGSRVAEIPETIKGHIKSLGLSHIFAASGFHLILIAGIFQFLLSKCRISTSIESSLIIIISLIYSALAGFSPSINRAVICLIIFYLAKFLNRKLDNIKLLTILAGIVIFIDPYTILDLGFQLSYLATLSILIWVKPITSKLENELLENTPRHDNGSLDKLRDKPNFIKIVFEQIFKYFKESLIISIAVQSLVAPLIIYYFKTFPIWSILANLIFTPILSLVIIFGLFGLNILSSPLLDLRLNLFKWSEYLPLRDYHLEFSFPSMIIMLILINLMLAIFCFKNFLVNKTLKSSLIVSLSLILLAKISPVYGSYEFYTRNQHFDSFLETQIREMKNKGDNYKYFSKSVLEGLIILDINSLAALKGLDKELREINLLVIPKLSANSIYLESLCRSLKPQIVIVSSKSKSPKIWKNLDYLKDKSHVIFNDGKLVVSDNKYWRIYN